MAMKKILVAGGAGFIGSHLVDRLLKRNNIDKLLVVDNLWTGDRSNLAHLRDERLCFEVKDIASFRTELRFDEVYHLASPASPNWYMSDPVATISSNIQGAFRLRELLDRDGRFCFTSTSEVYGDPIVSPQPESYRGSVDCTGPRSSYDESKRCTEAFLFECQRVHGLDIRVVRLFNVYGPRVRPDDGRAISNFICQALTGRALTIYGDGLQTRSWGYIDDIVEALERFFWRDAVYYKGPLNIGNNREVSVLETAQFIASLVPNTLIEFRDPVPQDPSNRRPDLTQAKRVLPGWTCNVPYETGIMKTLVWFQQLLEAEGVAEPHLGVSDEFKGLAQSI